ncbi:hypothetical protein BKA70DRAFT_1440930 [Coprinopsis sp. MPI-PUGE-AT-0042]|nr:hypothetical protein BKA70DRAFT_1440930 [Coprinopsis sp. MPI-PUGE-AT-0042]
MQIGIAISPAQPMEASFVGNPRTRSRSSALANSSGKKAAPHYLARTKPTPKSTLRPSLRDVLAVPVMPGIKSEKAGGLYTTTLGGFIPAPGRSIQAATSYCLGQNPSKSEMFNTSVQNPFIKGKLHHAWQSSWGLSTRAISMMVMAVVVPCGITASTSDEQRTNINNVCEELAQTLGKAGLMAKADLRDEYTPGYKFNDWGRKGVPLGLEIGPNQLAKKQTLTARRDTGAQNPVPRPSMSSILESIQADVFATANFLYWEHVKTATEWDDVVPALGAKNTIVIPWCGSEPCEDDIRDRNGRFAEPSYE